MDSVNSEIRDGVSNFFSWTEDYAPNVGHMEEEKMASFEYRGKPVHWDANATEACLLREKVFVTMVLQSMGTRGNVWVIQDGPIPKIMRKKRCRRAPKDQAQNLIAAWEQYIIDNPLIVPKFRPLQEIFGPDDK